MQLGSLLRSSRRRGPDIWEFIETGGMTDIESIRIKVGTLKQSRTEASARNGIVGPL
jgi:hypothetical protein